MGTLSPKEIDNLLDQQSASVLREDGGLVVILRRELPEQFAGSLQILDGVHVAGPTRRGGYRLPRCISHRLISGTPARHVECAFAVSENMAPVRQVYRVAE